MPTESIFRTLYRELPWVRRSEAIWLEARAARLAGNAMLVQELLRQPKHARPEGLARFEHQVFSQGGEDGVLQEIFRRIGTSNRHFVEFGVEDGIQNNTHFLLHQGWSGSWLEGSEENVAKIRRNFAGPLEKGQLTVKQSFITAENICDSFRELAVPKELDLLSIDIDGNDYWVWKSLDCRARVVVLEYNSNFPPPCDWVMPYDADHRYQGDLYFGASLTAYHRLAAELGYRLVGCSLNGVNAYFVREDLVANHFGAEASAEFHYEKPRFFLIDRCGHPASARWATVKAPR
ncbi:MAG: hypothetical protein JSR82_15765 [Verrucomicrobia bacterium]|nr:hypothetical protein [Verrucomicrobiota bacterium]